MKFKERKWIIDKIVETLRILSIHKLVKPVFNLYYQFFFRNIIKENIVLKNKNFGERCFIIGNGVSINNLDILSLNNSFTICCNEIYKYHLYKDFNPKVHVIVEPFYGRLFGKKYYQETYNLYSGLYKKSKNKNCLFFFHISLKDFFFKNKLFQDKKVYYVNTYKDNYEKKSNLASKFYFGDGALSFMMGLSNYMGFKQIILLGCGYSFDPRQEYHCYSRHIFKKNKYSGSSLEKHIKKIKHNSNSKMNLYEIEENDKYYMQFYH